MTQPALFDTASPEESAADNSSDIDAGDGGEAVSGLDTERPPVPPMEVRVIRSTRRVKSVQARVVDGVVELRIPASASAAQEERWKSEMLERFERNRSSSQWDLPTRAQELSKRYDLPVPTSVRWVSNQKFRWGSCTVSTATIRISDHVAAFPDWVVDYVLMHEMAHLVHADHSPAFWDLVARYPQAERAKGYLEAKADGR